MNLRWKELPEYLGFLSGREKWKPGFLPCPPAPKIAVFFRYKFFSSAKNIVLHNFYENCLLNYNIVRILTSPNPFSVIFFFSKKISSCFHDFGKSRFHFKNYWNLFDVFISFFVKTFKQLYFCKIVFSECFGIPSLTNQKKLKSKQSRVMYLVGVSLTVPSRSCLFSQFYFVNI